MSIMGLEDFLKKYADWKVYLYEPKEGKLFCPLCNDGVQALGKIPFFPPFICPKDKIFFHDSHNKFKNRKSVSGNYYCGDLQELYEKYKIMEIIGFNNLEVFNN